MARPCRQDEDMVALRLHVFVKVRSRSRQAFDREWYRRREPIVNLRTSARRAGKVDQMSSGLRLVATKHRGLSSGKHLLELEPSLSPLLTCTCSPQRTIRAFRRYAGKVWLLELGGLLQLGQLVCAMGIVGGQRVVSVRSSGERADEHGARSCDAAACRLSWRLAAHLSAARIRAVRNGFA